MEQPLIDCLTEIVGDEFNQRGHLVAAEMVMYTAAWLREEGFWQAANVLIDEVNRSSFAPAAKVARSS